MRIDLHAEFQRLSQQSTSANSKIAYYCWSSSPTHPFTTPADVKKSRSKHYSDILTSVECSDFAALIFLDFSRRSIRRPHWSVASHEGRSCVRSCSCCTLPTYRRWSNGTDFRHISIRRQQPDLRFLSAW
jgi:hypothetical protein